MGIYRGVVDADFIVEVRAGAVASAAHGADLLAVGRVVDRERSLVVRVHSLSIDVALLAEQVHVFQLNRGFDFL